MARIHTELRAGVTVAEPIRSGHETCYRLDFWVDHAQDWRLLRLMQWKAVVADG